MTENKNARICITSLFVARRLELRLEQIPTSTTSAVQGVLAYTPRNETVMCTSVVHSGSCTYIYTSYTDRMTAGHTIVVAFQSRRDAVEQVIALRLLYVDNSKEMN